MSYAKNNHSIIIADNLLPKKTAISIDVDWAPDFAIEELAMMLEDSKFPATWFVTHMSSAIESLAKQGVQVELGVHPNFFSGSSHGETHEEVIDHCMALVPNATSFRTHGVFQSTNLFSMIVGRYPNLCVDSSIYLPLQRDIQPVDMYFFEHDNRLVRFPYYWEDDLVAIRPDNRWDRVPATNGIRIFDFHPVHVALNSDSVSSYQALKKHLGSRPLAQARRDDFKHFINRGKGVRNFLRKVLTEIETSEFTTLSTMGRTYLDGTPTMNTKK